MIWLLVYTKPRQEKYALTHLERQGYACYLPFLTTEKVLQGALTVSQEPLFPRYLFVAMDDLHKSWAPIRSTKGVSRLVHFGQEPARVDPALIDLLKSQEHALQGAPRRLFEPGDRVRLLHGAFAGIEGVYQMTDGERRAMVLIELLSKPVAIRVPPAQLRKVN